MEKSQRGGGGTEDPTENLSAVGWAFEERRERTLVQGSGYQKQDRVRVHMEVPEPTVSSVSQITMRLSVLLCLTPVRTAGARCAQGVRPLVCKNQT